MRMFLELKLMDEYGAVHGVVRRELPRDAAFKGQRAAEEAAFPFPVAGESPLDAVVKVLQVREFRRDLLRHASTEIGGQLANFLEDREGWHGIDRQEQTDAIAKNSI